MNDVHRILFPVDFSTRCESTIPFVKEMVRAYNAELKLLHVVEIPLYWYGSFPPATAGAWDSFDDIYRMGCERLNNFACEHFGELAKTGKAQSACDRGDPGYAILSHANNGRTDLIMMPTHGHGPFRSFVLGSATTRVLQGAECPVWTGAHLEEEPASRHVQIRKIVCALDLERESLQVLQSAVSLSRKFGAELTLVHCVAAPESGPAENFLSEFDRFLADTARKRIAELQAGAGTNFEVFLEGGSISATVRDAARRYGADLVVIGRGHAQAAFSRLRSNAFAIIRQSPCPVLSL